MERLLLLYSAVVLILIQSQADAQLELQLHRALQLKPRDLSLETYCGNTLSSKLSLVCQGRYNTLQKLPPVVYRKRDTISKPYYKNADPAPSELPIISREEANMFLRERRRVRRGITDECCKKPCTLDEIKSFCID